MKIEKVPIGQLTPDPDNAKEHTPKQIAQIKASIERFGNNDPIAVWGKDNLIVEGHGRYEALKALGYKEAEIIRLDRLTDEERRAYALAHNQLTMNTGWLDGILGKNLDAIESIDMADFGFDVVQSDADIDTEITEDEIPETVKTRTSLGQLWKLGDHRLICGDSTDAKTVTRLTGGGTVDLLLTDPPYNVDYEGGTDDALTIQNDNMSEDEFRAFLLSAFNAAYKVMKAGCPFYVWHAHSSALAFESALECAGLHVRQQLIWNKNTLVLGRQDYQWKHEPCFYGWKGGATHYFVDDRAQTTVVSDKKEVNPRAMKKEQLIALVKELQEDKVSTTVLNEDKPARNLDHPTMKPLKLLARLIKNSSRQREVVLDTFGGSGSTLIACEQLGRKCYMAELDPRYCDVIIQRWENFTGRKAELLEG